MRKIAEKGFDFYFISVKPENTSMMDQIAMEVFVKYNFKGKTYSSFSLNNIEIKKILEESISKSKERSLINEEKFISKVPNVYEIDLKIKMDREIFTAKKNEENEFSIKEDEKIKLTAKTEEKIMDMLKKKNQFQ